MYLSQITKTQPLTLIVFLFDKPIYFAILIIENKYILI